MSLRPRTLRILSALLPAGALGMSIALAPEAAQASPAKPANAESAGVAARLQGIRDAVSTVALSGPTVNGAPQQSDPNILKAWWRNWPNWHNGWANGGWRNGGWKNWNNGWHNWGNGWHNW